MKKINKHLQKIEDHYESIIDSIDLDEKTIQMFSVLFGIAKKVNDKTMNKRSSNIHQISSNCYCITHTKYVIINHTKYKMYFVNNIEMGKQKWMTKR